MIKKIKKNHSKKFVVLLLVSFLAACSSIDKIPTVIPPVVEDVSPSWDGNKQNSGIIEYVKDKGFLITENAAKRYTELTKIYGPSLVPALQEGEGLIKEDGKIYLPNQYMIEFIMMNQKFKRGEK